MERVSINIYSMTLAGFCLCFCVSSCSSNKQSDVAMQNGEQNSKANIHLKNREDRKEPEESQIDTDSESDFVETKEPINGNLPSVVGKVLSEDELVEWARKNKVKLPRWMRKQELLFCNPLFMFSEPAIGCKIGIFAPAGLHESLITYRYRILLKNRGRLQTVFDKRTGLYTRDGFDDIPYGEETPCDGIYVTLYVSHNKEKEMVLYVPSKYEKCGCPGTAGLKRSLKDPLTIEQGYVKNIEFKIEAIESICDNLGTYHFNEKKQKYVHVDPAQ